MQDIVLVYCICGYRPEDIQLQVETYTGIVTCTIVLGGFVGTMILND
jgi:hypothetical protein